MIRVFVGHVSGSGRVKWRRQENPAARTAPSSSVRPSDGGSQVWMVSSARPPVSPPPASPSALSPGAQGLLSAHRAPTSAHRASTSAQGGT